MKRILVLIVALLTLVAFTGSAMAQGTAQTEKPAAAPEKTAPAPAAEKAKAEKAKAEKPKTAKSMKASGTVTAYEEGKMITVKGAKNKEWTFDVTPDTKMKGEIKEGAKVTVTYKKEGNKMVASAISVAKAKKKTASKK
jgi:Cu/Ag efflux protein CusF